ncbi:MAG: hypothetical protein HWN79_07880 [Candidatus Lokiarchaeota archaeon]|nr:hypothetical protein [Candidatus Lokiarchaeota archaeon]
MSKKNVKEEDNPLMSNDTEIKRNLHVDWGRQGAVIFAYIIVLLGYFGIVANTILLDDRGLWIPFTEMDPTVLFWTYKLYPQTFYLPLFLLFFICVFLTYKEDIPHYGIKASLWLVPSLIVEGFLWYWIMLLIQCRLAPNPGICILNNLAQPFIYQFAYGEGYLNIIILYGCTFTGALSGMKLKQFVRIKRKF